MASKISMKENVFVGVTIMNWREMKLWLNSELV